MLRPNEDIVSKQNIFEQLKKGMQSNPSTNEVYVVFLAVFRIRIRIRIRIKFVSWIRIRIPNADPDPDPAAVKISSKSQNNSYHIELFD